jgi:RNA-directed DNA polymerase
MLYSRTQPSPPGITHFLDDAYQWLCRAREKAPANHSIWHLRWSWKHTLPKITQKLTTHTYRFSPVRLIKSTDGSHLECWEPSDSIVLKALTLHLQPALLPHLSKKCYHLSGRGGVKAATSKIQNLLRSGSYPYVARSDAKGYYANIQHTRLLELLRQHTSDPITLDLVSQYCQRSITRGGYYAERRKGISLGCPISPLMGALYLSPLDQAMSKLPGIRYLRFMDDWVILAESRWKLRRAVRIMNQVLQQLGLAQHPDKTFIGRTARGFDFLGIQFTATGDISPSAVSIARHTEKTAQLYEQGAPQERIEQYRQNWLRYLRGILGSDTPATKDATLTPPPNAMPQQYLSSLNHSHWSRCPRAGATTTTTKINENENKIKTEQTSNLPSRDRWGRMCHISG